MLIEIVAFYGGCVFFTLVRLRGCAVRRTFTEFLLFPPAPSDGLLYTLSPELAVSFLSCLEVGPSAPDGELVCPSKSSSLVLTGTYRPLSALSITSVSSWSFSTSLSSACPSSAVSTSPFLISFSWSFGALGLGFEEEGTVRSGDCSSISKMKSVSQRAAERDWPLLWTCGVCSMIHSQEENIAANSFITRHCLRCLMPTVSKRKHRIYRDATYFSNKFE